MNDFHEAALTIDVTAGMGQVYKKAIEEIKGSEVSEIGIFSFSLSEYFNNKNIS